MIELEGLEPAKKGKEVGEIQTAPQQDSEDKNDVSWIWTGNEWQYSTDVYEIEDKKKPLSPISSVRDNTLVVINKTGKDNRDEWEREAPNLDSFTDGIDLYFKNGGVSSPDRVKSEQCHLMCDLGKLLERFAIAPPFTKPDSRNLFSKGGVTEKYSRILDNALKTEIQIQKDEDVPDSIVLKIPIDYMDGNTRITDSIIGYRYKKVYNKYGLHKDTLHVWSE
jgi:hypothetical protein